MPFLSIFYQSIQLVILENQCRIVVSKYLIIVRALTQCCYKKGDHTMTSTEAYFQKRKRNQPKDTNLRQQRLDAVRFHLTIYTVCPWAVVIGVAVFGVGLGTYFGVDASLKTRISYGHNCTEPEIPGVFSSGNGSTTMATPPPSSNICTLKFSLDKAYKGDVRFYYGLSKFYQNFRLYLSSREDLQLDGDIYRKDLDSCAPYDYDNFMPIVPCGAIANSMFNDTFELFYVKNGLQIKVPLNASGVFSNLQHRRKFKNPAPFDGELCAAFQNTSKPVWWQRPICELGIQEDGQYDPDVGVGLENVDFMVWMNTAALPSFLKPYRNLDTSDASGVFFDGLPIGEYHLRIRNNYPMKHLHGEKFFVITSESWMGPRNFFLPIIYMVVGLFIAFSFTFLFLLAKLRPRFFKESDE